MCNRYSLSKKQEHVITREYGSVEFYFMQRFNIAPTQNAQVIVVENGKLISREMKWGWKTKFGLMTNARAESAHETMFKEAMANRRCLVPADGLTANARGLVRSFHDRMPVILPETEIEPWLTEPVEKISGPNGIASRALSEPLKTYPVTTQMSNPRFESPESIEPIHIAQGELF